MGMPDYLSDSRIGKLTFSKLKAFLADKVDEDVSAASAATAVPSALLLHGVLPLTDNPSSARDAASTDSNERRFSI